MRRGALLSGCKAEALCGRRAPALAVGLMIAGADPGPRPGCVVIAGNTVMAQSPWRTCQGTFCPQCP
jgi:hypothetical protein